MAKTPDLSVYHQLETVIRAIAGGTFFSACFTKKDGAERHMVCRLNVQKDLTGAGLAYDPHEHGYLIVWDVQKEGYRTINLTTLKWIQLRGVRYNQLDDGRWDETNMPELPAELEARANAKAELIR